MTKPDEDTKTGDALLDRAKPAEFPLDVWGAAVAAVSAGLRDERQSIAVRMTMAGLPLNAMLESVARAILAERERCANVAYDAAVKAFDGPCLSEVAIMGAADIAAAIRSGKQ